MHGAVARCLTPKVSDTQAAADAGAVRNSVRIDAPGGGTVSDSEGVRHPRAAARLAADAGPCGTQLGLMRVIFEPSSPTPAIRPFWPNGMAYTSCVSVVLVRLAAMPLSTTTTDGPAPMDQPSLRSRYCRACSFMKNRA